MINVGMDFGNAYTIISIYRNDTGQAEILDLGMTSACIPSLTALDQGSFKCGVTAKGCIGKENVRFFNCFKQLLTEENKDCLHAFGFDGAYTPEKIARIYIEEILRQMLVHCHVHVIDHLVIAVPEMWYGGSRTDGREVIQRICAELAFVRHVQLISEPVAAGAFLTQNFRTMTGQPFDGHMLIVDYGAQNLELTLLEVSAGKAQTVSAEVLEYTRDSENGSVWGYAGLAYLKKLVALVISEDSTADGKILQESNFWHAVMETEEALKTKAEKIEDIFDEYGVDDIETLDCLDFAAIHYGAAIVRVTYGQLLRAYREVIAPVLREKLDEMIYMMKIHNVCYEERMGSRFKIAVTGGFGSFCLVHKQIRDRFEFNTYDQRQSRMMLQEYDGVYAVSKGAALIAAGAAVIPRNAPYGIGVGAYSGTNSQRVYAAIRCGQPLICDKIYYAKDMAGEPYVFYVPSGSLNGFWVSVDNNRQKYTEAAVKQPYVKYMQNVIQNRTRTAVIGFSLDSAGILSVHIYDYDISENHMAPEAKVVELARFEDVFEMTEVIKGGDGV